MISYLTSLLCGFIFAIGLGISGMLDPYKMQNFFDITGTWDPTFLMIMAGAIGVAGLLYPVVLRKGCPLYEKEFVVPEEAAIGWNVVLGTMIFSFGWLLGGLCPGAVLANSVIDGLGMLLYAGSMIATIVLHRYLFL